MGSDATGTPPWNPWLCSKSPSFFLGQSLLPPVLHDSIPDPIQNEVQLFWLDSKGHLHFLIHPSMEQNGFPQGSWRCPGPLNSLPTSVSLSRSSTMVPFQSCPLQPALLDHLGPRISLYPLEHLQPLRVDHSPGPKHQRLL